MDEEVEISMRLRSLLELRGITKIGDSDLKDLSESFHTVQGMSLRVDSAVEQNAESASIFRLTVEGLV